MMMKVKKISVSLYILLTGVLSHNSWAKIDSDSANLYNKLQKNDSSYDYSLPLTVDNRIKTYVYNANEVYLLLVHFGYQSHIEFAKGEEIATISLGDSYAWSLTPLDNRLFIKAMEKNIRTNMTIITNKRTYQFDLVSKELSNDNDQLVYVVRFFYPKVK